METPDDTFINTWRIRAAEQQQAFYTLFSDREWDKLDKKHYEFNDNLKLKISFAVFARPYADCEPVQQQRVKAIIHEILRLSDANEFVCVGYTYVITGAMFHEGIIPLIRVKGDDDKTHFIESEFTFVYNEWSDFLISYKLDYCEICYPKNGIYKRRAEGRVLLEYCVSGSPMNSNLGISIKPSDTHLFFPFAKCSVYDTQISVQWSMTFVTLKETTSRVLKSCNDMDFLAVWLELLSPGFGSILKKANNLVSFSIETDRVKDCVELFKQFYETPYSVNGYFAVVTLMKMVAFRSIKQLSPRLLRYFSELLKFILNISVSQTSVVENIIKVISDEDLFRHNNLFNATFNCPYREIKELEFYDNVKDISRIISSLAGAKEEDTPLVKLSKKFLIVLTNIIRLKHSNSEELCLSVSDIIFAFNDKFYQQYHQETKRLKELLQGKTNALMSNTAHLILSIEQFPNDLLRKVLWCVKRVSSKLAPENEKLKDVFGREFLFYAFQFVQEMGAFNLEDGDVLSFLVGKFVPKCEAFLAERESKNASGFEVEASFFNFVSILSDTSTVSEFKSDYEALKTMSKTKLFPITSFNGIRLYGKMAEVHGLEDLLFPRSIFETCEEMARDYLGMNKIPEESINGARNVIMFSNGSKEKFTLNFLAFPRKMEDILKNRDSDNVVTFSLTFTLPL